MPCDTRERVQHQGPPSRRAARAWELSLSPRLRGTGTPPSLRSCTRSRRARARGGSPAVSSSRRCDCAQPPGSTLKASMVPPTETASPQRRSLRHRRPVPSGRACEGSRSSPVLGEREHGPSGRPTGPAPQCVQGAHCEGVGRQEKHQAF